MFFYKLLWQPWSSRVLMPFSQQCLLPSGLLSHFIASQNIKHFHCYCMCYSDLWSAIFEVIVLGHHNLRPYETANLTHKCCVSWPPPLSLSLPRDFLFPETTILKLSQSITLSVQVKTQWPQSVQVKKEELRISHLNLKAANKLSKEGTSRKPRKAKTRPLVPIHQGVNTKQTFLKDFYKCCSSQLDEW